MTLLEVPVGSHVRIHHVKAHPDVSRRLREIGLFEHALVSCVTKNPDSIICGISNTRIGIDRRLARSIQVSPADQQTP
jgi:Fe2+ transport system protein FeoA